MKTETQQRDPRIDKTRLVIALGLLEAENANMASMNALLAVIADRLTRLFVRTKGVEGKDALIEARRVLHQEAPNIQTALEAEILRARTHAREIASVANNKAIDVVSEVLAEHGIPHRPEELRPHRPTAASDALTTDRAAAGATARVLTTVVTNSVEAGVQAGEDPAEAAASIPERVAGRTKRVVVTETSRGYNDELDDRTDARARSTKGTPAGQLLYKRWEAVLDRRVCAICANLDNQVVRVNEPFRYGYIPGSVHPHCRCIQVPAAYSTDLNLGQAVTRDMFGPGLGRMATRTVNNYPSFAEWTEEERAEWDKRYRRAQRDAEYRHRILKPEVRRHDESVKTGVESTAPMVPRIRKGNQFASDRRTPRAVHEAHLGKQIGAEAAHYEYGELVPNKK